MHEMSQKQAPRPNYNTKNQPSFESCIYCPARMSESENDRNKSQDVNGAWQKVAGSVHEHQVTELKIPVPWGHVAARAWGNPSHEPVLTVHGTMDNAASFDHLLPLLPAGRFYFVCLDLPGHGHSSHLPAGAMYRVFDFVTVLRMVLEHFKWPQVILLCHSLGGIIAYFFASVFPDMVKKMIVIDFVSQAFLPQKFHILLPRHYHGKLLAIEKKMSNQKPPSYSFEQAVQMLISQRPSTLSNASARTLLLRELKKVGDGQFMFRKDQRLKSLMYPTMDEAQYVALLNFIKCPLMVILAKQSTMKDLPVAGKLMSMFRRNCAVFKCHEVEGGHDVHLNDPSIVAPLIMNFLYTPDSAL